MIMKHSIIYTPITYATCSLYLTHRCKMYFSCQFLCTLSYKYVILEMGFEPMHTICTKPQPHCSPTELLKQKR